MKKSERRLVFLIGFIALLIFTFTDLQISQAICRKQPAARVLEVIGEIPFMVMALCGCAILVRFRNRRNKVSCLLSVIGFGLLFVLLSTMGGFMIWNYLSKNLENIPVIFALLIGLAMAAISILITLKIPADKKQQALSFAITAILYFVLVLIVMNVLKSIWGRMRFREMADPLTQFTPWYQIMNRGGFSDIYASFPSGHSMNSAAVILLTLLPGFLPQLEGKERILKIVAYVWIIIVGSSRIMMGAHFASDVTVGIMLSLLLSELTRTIIYKIRETDKTHI